MRNAVFFLLALLVVVSTGPHQALAKRASQYGAVEPKTTVLETSSGRRLVVSTDASGTKVTEERSGREVWRSTNDRHEVKVKEYARSGAKVVPPKK